MIQRSRYGLGLSKTRGLLCLIETRERKGEFKEW